MNNIQLIKILLQIKLLSVHITILMIQRKKVQQAELSPLRCGGLVAKRYANSGIVIVAVRIFNYHVLSIHSGRVV